MSSKVGPFVQRILEIEMLPHTGNRSDSDRIVPHGVNDCYFVSVASAIPI